MTWELDEAPGASNAADARRAFAGCVAGGTPTDALRAALWVCAEDDAAVSSSPVPFPVDLWAARVDKMAREVARVHLPAALDASDDVEAVVRAVERYFYSVKGFAVLTEEPIEPGVRVEHPGVYEKPKAALVHEVLARRSGTPAAVAIVLGAVFRRLLETGAIGFAVVVTPPLSTCTERPRVEALPGFRGAGATAVGTVSSVALEHVLRTLKRSYWPFAWDTALDRPEDGPCGGGGGFLAAAEGFLGGGAADGDVEKQLIARTAAHRLERGIFTTTGAGDLVRAIAAAERLVLLCGDAGPREARDLGVLLAHAGVLPEAEAHLAAFAGSASALDATPRERQALEALLDVVRAMIAAGVTRDAPLAQNRSRKRQVPW